jgi:putative oxidoreductase
MAHSHYVPRWMYSYSTVIFTFFRALLGLFLFVKGIYFVFDNQHLSELIQHSKFNYYADFLAYFISISHLVGGAFIAIGLLTRIAIILQLPVLFAAVIFNLTSKTFGSPFELFLALLILVMLIYYLINGPGKISMDEYRKNEQI